MGMRGGAVFHMKINLRRGRAGGLVDEVAEGALQLQGFGGAGAGGCAEIGKAESGNRNTEGAAVSASFLLSPSSYFLRPCFITPLVFALRFPLSGFSFLLRAQVSESSSVAAAHSWV